METTPWQEVLGCNNWDNLLEPLDINVLELILRAGDFCQATYDSFNNDQNSKYCGTCRFGKDNFFRKVALRHAQNYQVESYLYATALVSLPEAYLLHSQSRDAWDRESNWFGYIAVTTDDHSQAIGRREVYVVFRGTTRNYEWIDVLGCDPDPAHPIINDPDGKSGAKVMQGWVSIYMSGNPKSEFTKLSLREQLLRKIKEIRQRYEGEDLCVVFCGHSLGACISILASIDLVENVVGDEVPVTAVVFGSPGVGNKEFNERYDSHRNLNALHVRNCRDMIPHYPGRMLGYKRTGVELLIDTEKSPYLKKTRTIGDWHNLQAMLHVVAGWHGKDAEFELRVKRSIALVNKSCEFLKDDLGVPGSWWVEKNKGLILDEEGEWVAAPPDADDLPVPEFDYQR